jgi:uncharacterized protein (TIGR01777 family)
MKIAISGGTGFVGQYLVQNLFEDNKNEIIYLSREVLSKSTEELSQILENSDIIINLAGTPIVNRWSESYKKSLYKSRINTTNKIVSAVNSLKNRPHLFISTSAIGIYKKDTQTDDYEFTHTEEKNNYDSDFLANLCKDWEKEANNISDEVRTVIFRFGVVFGKNGGALSKMLTPFKLGLGGIIGNGKQHTSFIHIEDLKNAFDFTIKNKNISGTFNLVSPDTITNFKLTKTLGKILKRPTLFPVPAFVLKAIFGQGSTVLIDGQKVFPKKLLDSGFEFKFSTIENTLNDIIKNK